MRRSLFRACTVAAGALLCSPVTAAAADPTLPGCYGAATAIVCNVTVDVRLPYAVGTTQTTVPVCAGTCTDVPVTLVQATATWPGEVCVSYTDRSGTQQSRTCRTLNQPTVPDTSGLVAEVVSLLTRYELRGCGPFDTGFYVYDNEQNRPLANTCFDTFEPECDIEARPICRLN